MRTLIVAVVAAAVVLAQVLFVVSVCWAAMVLGRSVRGEARRPAEESPAAAPGVDGGHEPRGGGVPDATRSQSRGPGAHPCPSVPARELIDGYRPARENRYWVNDFAIAGALSAWSKEGSR